MKMVRRVINFGKKMNGVTTGSRRHLDIVTNFSLKHQTAETKLILNKYRMLHQAYHFFAYKLTLKEGRDILSNPKPVFEITCPYPRAEHFFNQADESLGG